MVLAQRLIGESLITGAASMRDVSLSEAGCFEDLPGRHSVIPEGFESVIGLLERSIPPGNILRNSVVSSICWDSGDQEYPVKVVLCVVALLFMLLHYFVCCCIIACVVALLCVLLRCLVCCCIVALLYMLNF